MVELPEGRHEFKFVVDGQWYHKPDEVSFISLEIVSSLLTLAVVHHKGTTPLFLV